MARTTTAGCPHGTNYNFFLGDNTSGSQTVTITGFDGDTGPYMVVMETADDLTGDISSGTKGTLSLDSTMFGVIHNGSDVDIFEMVLDNETEVFLYTTGNTDTKGTLLDGTGNALTPSASDDDSGEGLNFRIDRLLSAGTYLVKVEGFDADETGPYALFAKPVQVLPYLEDTRASGDISEWPDQHYYRFDVPGDGIDKRDTWIFATGIVDSYGTLYDGDLNVIGFNDDSGLIGRELSFNLR